MPSPSLVEIVDERWRLRILAVIAVAITVAAIGEGGSRDRDWALLPFAAAGFVVVAAVPRLPSIVAALPAVVFALVANMTDTEVEFAMFLPVIGVLLMAWRESNRLLVLAFFGLTAGLVFVLSITGVYDWAWLNWMVGIGFGWTFGALIHHYDRLLAELRSTQATMLDQAALVERRRIARDVHDLIGHSLAVVTLHVAGARRLIRSDPDEAEAALLQAEQAGRDAMAEVRRSVAMMREEHTDDAANAPTPNLTDIATVIDQYRSAGVPIDYRVDGPVDRVDGPRAVAVYRIAQEALANVTRHTADATTDVSLEVDEHTCRLLVRNRGGRVVRPAGDSHGAAGNGLIGMRERALSVDGSLLVGPVGDGWSVELSVPLGDTRSTGAR